MVCYYFGNVIFNFNDSRCSFDIYIYFFNSLLISYAIRYATERQIGQLCKLAATNSVVLLSALKVKGSNRSMEFKFSAANYANKCKFTQFKMRSTILIATITLDSTKTHCLCQTSNSLYLY